MLMLTSDFSIRIQYNIQIIAQVRRKSAQSSQYSLLMESLTSASAVGVRGAMIHLKGTGCLIR